MFIFLKETNTNSYERIILTPHYEMLFSRDFELNLNYEENFETSLTFWTPSLIPTPIITTSDNHQSRLHIYELGFCYCCFVFVCLLRFHPWEITQYLSFSVWFISLSIMPWGPSMLLQMASFHFLWLNNILLHMYIPHSFVYSSINGHWVVLFFHSGCLVSPASFIEATVLSPLYILGSFVVN